MNQFKTIYQYELKKLLKRKLFWVTLLILILCQVFTVYSGLLGSYYIDGELADTHYHMFLVDSAYRRALSGRVLDQELLEETVHAYKQIVPEGNPQQFRYTVTEEYQTYARPYSEIFNIISAWTGMEFHEVIQWEADENTLYEARLRNLEAAWQSVHLSDAEKVYWREKEDQLEIPFTYYYHEGYQFLLSTAFITTGVLMLLFISICLSSTYSQEHTRRTDQLILSSAKGRSTVYWAKIFAGSTVTATCAMLMTILIWALGLAVYGAEGFGTSMQIYAGSYSYPMTIGGACLIAYGILILTSVLMAIFVMVLSEALHSNIGTLAISAGLIISGQIIMIPDEYRILAQFWDCLPTNFLVVWNIYSARLVNLFGHCFTRWQVVPIAYVICGIVIAVIGKQIFQRYQVSGR